MEEMNIEEDTGKGPAVTSGGGGGGGGNGGGDNGNGGNGSAGVVVACKDFFTTNVDHVPSALTWAIRNVEILSSRYPPLPTPFYP